MKKIIALFILMHFYGFANGQNKNPYSVTFNHVALSVKDVDQSAEFYKNTLNLQEITNKAKSEGIRWFSLGEGKELHVISTLKDPIVTNKAVHLALTTSDFDLLLPHLQPILLFRSI